MGYFQCANLTEASLIEASPQGQILIKANLAWVNLHGVDLKGDNFRKAHYLTFDQLSKVKILPVR